jgi:hypothetical protein
MSETRKQLDVAALCGLPLVRRAYMALVVGLAVFIATLVVLREPFRGYLAEVRIGGPATGGLDLDDATIWLKQADEGVAVIATAPGERSRRSQIRMTYLAPLPTPAQERLDELAGRWLYQYLPQRLNAFRQAELRDLRAGVNEARAREDEAGSELELLRQRQLALLLRPGVPGAGSGGPRTTEGSGDPRTTEDPDLDRRPASAQELPLPVTAIPPLPTAPGPWRERLEALRLELARLLASFTEAHPQVIALRLQIERLEGQQPGSQAPFSRPGDGPELIPAPAVDRQAREVGRIRPAVADRLVTARTSAPAITAALETEAGALAAAVSAAIARQSEASRARQAAEHRLSDRMQELSNQPTAADWSAEPAHVVTRLGGTPRCATLSLAGLLATAAGVVVFRGSAVAVVPGKIESAGELASALELPVIGNLAARGRSAGRMPWRVFTAGRVRLLVHGAEAIVALAVLACLLSICVEPTLARQVLADPFGTLSEMMGRAGI